MGTHIKVLIIDDHPLFRDALELALHKLDNDNVMIDKAGSLAEAQTHIKNQTYSLILLDLNMADTTDFEGISKVKGISGDTPILIVSAVQSPAASLVAKSLGASGFIQKSQSLTEITKAIQTVLSGKTIFPEHTGKFDNQTLIAADRLSSLTPAQQRVMTCLSDGLLNKQIAYEMSISEATVKAHMTAIFRKLNVNNRTQALLAFREATRILA